MSKVLADEETLFLTSSGWHAIAIERSIESTTM